MIKTISLKDARDRFSDLVDKADRLSERFVVTRNGLPKAVVVSAEEFESWVETLEFMSNPKAVKALEQGLSEQRRRSSVRSRRPLGKISERSPPHAPSFERSGCF
jgi:prevent-host-death family protein